MSRHALGLAGSSVETPFVDTSPQLEIRNTPLHECPGASDYHRDYRVYNYRRLENGQTLRGDGWSFVDAAIIGGLVCAAWRWGLIALVRSIWTSRQLAWTRDELLVMVCTSFLVLYTRRKCNVVLYECVTPIPGIGIQLSVVRGVSLPSPIHPKSVKHRILIRLSTSHTMVPLSEISTVILNQGLSGFGVKYYLGIVKAEGSSIVVALDSTRPGFEALREVYHGIREIMFDEFSHGHKPEGRREHVE